MILPSAYEIGKASLDRITERYGLSVSEGTQELVFNLAVACPALVIEAAIQMVYKTISDLETDKYDENMSEMMASIQEARGLETIEEVILHCLEAYRGAVFPRGLLSTEMPLVPEEEEASDDE